MGFLLFLSDFMVPLIIFILLVSPYLEKDRYLMIFIWRKRGDADRCPGPSFISWINDSGRRPSCIGILEFLTHILEVPATSIGLPGPIIPIAFIRLVSNSAAVGLVLDLFKNYGPDSQVGLMASILMGSTETVLYCMSVYFGSAGISRTRYTLAGGLLAAFVSLAASVILANQLAL